MGIPNLKLPPDTVWDRASIVAHLGSVALFSELHGNPAALETLAGLMVPRSYAPGEDIISEGGSGSEMFLLVEGQAIVFKSTSEHEPYRVAVLNGKQFAFFGEGGLLGSEARSATIQAETQCRCLLLQREAFEAFAQENPKWAMPILLFIARTVLGRLRKTNHEMNLLYNALIEEIRGH